MSRNKHQSGNDRESKTNLPDPEEPQNPEKVWSDFQEMVRTVMRAPKEEVQDLLQEESRNKRSTRKKGDKNL